MAFQKKKLNKGDFFIKQGSIASELAFIESGLLQFYTINKQFEERTTYISLSNTFATSVLSFLNQIPSRENIKALNDTIIWVIEKEDLVKLMEDIPRFKNFYIKLIEYQLCCIDKSRLDLITLNAQERYEILLKEEPKLFQQVPLQYISSMLGITARHMSRLRKIV